MPAVIFPGGTFFSCFRGASLEVPTRLSAVLWFLHGQKEQWLSLDMGRNISPTLLETLNGLERNCQELSHFFLGFSQSVANSWKLFFLHHPTCQRQENACSSRSTLTLLVISPQLINCPYKLNYMPHSGIRASLFAFPGLILVALQCQRWNSPFVSQSEWVSGNLTPITFRFSIINIAHNIYCPVFTQTDTWQQPQENCI